jgi:hypothetical protein
MEAVLILFNKKYTWNEAKLMLNNVNEFKASLVGYPKD